MLLTTWISDLCQCWNGAFSRVCRSRGLASRNNRCRMLRRVEPLEDRTLLSPTISINDVSHSEGDSGTTQFDFTVSLSEPSDLSVTFELGTSDGTATVANQDYTPLAEFVTFNPGEVQRTFHIQVNGNPQAEPDEVFLVNLSHPVNATVSTEHGHGLGTILDDDSTGGAKYYINDSSTVLDVFTTAAGDNSFDGKSPDKPVASLNAFFTLYQNQLHSGDTIYVDTGSYSLARNIVLGAQQSGIHIVGAGRPELSPDDTPIPNSGTLINRGNTADGSYVFEMTGADNIIFSGLGMTGGEMGIYAGPAAGSQSLTAYDLNIFGMFKTIRLEASNDHAGIYRSDIEGAPGNDANFNGSRGLFIGGASATISGNNVFGITYFGIQTQGYHPIITDNSVHDNYAGGIYVEYGIDGLIADNDVFHNSSAASGSGADGPALYGSDQGTFPAAVGEHRLIISNNTVHDNSCAGLQGYGGETVFYGAGQVSNAGETEVDNNLVYGNTYSGIVLVGTSTAKYNTVFDNANGIVGGPTYVPFGGFQTNPQSVINNIVFNNHQVGISLVGPGIAQGNVVYSNSIGIQGVRQQISFGPGDSAAVPFFGSIRNNLVYENTDAGIQIAGSDSASITNNTVYARSGDAVQVVANDAGYAAKNVTLQNNILWSESGYDIDVSNVSQSGFSSDYNLLYASGSGKIAFWQSDITSLADWKLIIGQDPHALSANPQFINPTGGDEVLGFDNDGTDGGQDDDFHLRATSPAVDRGNPAASYSTEPSPNGGRIDLGAYGNTAEATPSTSVGAIVRQTDSSTAVTVGGLTDVYTIVLTSQPTDTVVVTFQSDDQVGVLPETLMFEPDNWNVAQQVTVYHKGGLTTSGDVVISHILQSSDSRYNNLAIPTVTVHISGNGGNPGSVLAITSDLDEKSEGNSGTSSFTFTVSRTSDISSPASAVYAVTGSGVAAADAADFGGTFPTGAVNFAAGVTSQTIVISVSGDTTVENDEGFTVTLSDASPSTTIATAAASTIILNDDSSVPSPTLSIAATAASKPEANNGSTAFTFTVTRAGDTSGTCSASYAVTGSGTHPADGTDFGGSFPAGTITFAAGATSRTITVNVSGDTTIENDEGFTVTLSNPNSGTTITTFAAVSTIVNDDSAGVSPTLSISSNSDNVVESNTGSTPFTFTVTRTGNTTGASTVKYTVNGSGAHPANAADFGGILPSGTLTFAAGVGSRTITINVSGDSITESDEGFTVTLSNVTGATLDTPVASATILNDDINVNLGTPSIHLASNSLSYQAKSNAVAIDPNATFDLSHAALSVDAGLDNAARKQNVFAIRSVGSGAGQIQVSGNQVLFGGQFIGQFTIIRGVLNVQFSASASSNAVAELIHALTFSTKKPKPASRAVKVSFSMNGTFNDVVSSSRTIAITR
jgi:parallel beta-helix repeat protein